MIWSVSTNQVDSLWCLMTHWEESKLLFFSDLFQLVFLFLQAAATFKVRTSTREELYEILNYSTVPSLREVPLLCSYSQNVCWGLIQVFLKVDLYPELQSGPPPFSHQLMNWMLWLFFRFMFHQYFQLVSQMEPAFLFVFSEKNTLCVEKNALSGGFTVICPTPQTS